MAVRELVEVSLLHQAAGDFMDEEENSQVVVPVAEAATGVK
jgi:hypothetical protein